MTLWLNLPHHIMTQLTPDVNYDCDNMKIIIGKCSKCMFIYHVLNRTTWKKLNLTQLNFTLKLPDVIHNKKQHCLLLLQYEAQLIIHKCYAL